MLHGKVEKQGRHFKERERGISSLPRSRTVSVFLFRRIHGLYLP
jgi:hypothetical protein